MADNDITQELQQYTQAMQGMVSQLQSFVGGIKQLAGTSIERLTAENQVIRARNKALSEARGVQLGYIKELMRAKKGLEEVAQQTSDNIIVHRAQAQVLLDIGRHTNTALGAYKAHVDAIRSLGLVLGAMPKYGKQAELSLIKSASNKSGGKIISTLAAGFVDAMPTIAKMGSSLKDMSPWGMLLSIAIKGIMGAVAGGMDTFRQLLGTVHSANIGWGQSIKLYGQLSYWSSVYGASSEEAMSALKALTEGYAINTLMIGKRGDAEKELLNRIGPVVGKIAGMGKVLGLSTEQISSLIVSASQMGAPMETLDDTFKRLAGTAKAAFLTVGDFTGIMATLAPVSRLTKNAVERTEAVFLGLADTFAKSKDPLFEMVKSSGRMAELAASFKGLADAAARMDVAPLMAVLSTKTLYTNINDLVGAAATANRPEAMLDLVKMVGRAAQDSTGAMALFLSQQQNIPINQAHVLGKLLTEQMDAAARGDREGETELTKSIRAEMENLGMTAANTAAMKDPLQYMANILEKIFSLLTGFATGGVGGMLGVVLGSGRGAGTTPTAPYRLVGG